VLAVLVPALALLIGYWHLRPNGQTLPDGLCWEQRRHFLERLPGDQARGLALLATRDHRRSHLVYPYLQELPVDRRHGQPVQHPAGEGRPAEPGCAGV